MVNKGPAREFVSVRTLAGSSNYEMNWMQLERYGFYISLRWPGAGAFNLTMVQIT
jgi:hypothetical protein